MPSLYEAAPHGSSVTPTLAALYWTVVEECLVEFHNFSREDAVARVKDFWKRLFAAMASLPAHNGDCEDQNKYIDIIYHAEPWLAACDLAQHQISIESNVA